MKKLKALLLFLMSGAAIAQSTSKPDLTVAPIDELKAQMRTTVKSTKPDYIVFVPEISELGVSDTGNEHFLVFEGPDKSLMAVWTQSSHEGQPDQHIIFRKAK